MVRKIKKYQQIIENYLQEEASDRNTPGIEWEVVCDTKQHHYQLVENGWYNNRYIYRVLFHLHIKEKGTVWLLVNNTEIQVAEELVKRSIPASDIVLGFHSEKVRAYTGFAVA